MRLQFLTPLFAAGIAAASFSVAPMALAAEPVAAAAAPCGPAARRDALSPRDAAAIAMAATSPEKRARAGEAAAAVDQTSRGPAACSQSYDVTTTTTEDQNCRWVAVPAPKSSRAKSPARAWVCEPQDVDVRIY